jgi:hypothetical protein
VRCADGALTIAEQEFDNFANLVWSLDSEWIVFSTPFAPRQLWTAHPTEANLGRLEFNEKALALLCDISDVLPRAN